MRKGPLVIDPHPILNAPVEVEYEWGLLCATDRHRWCLGASLSWDDGDLYALLHLGRWVLGIERRRVL